MGCMKTYQSPTSKMYIGVGVFFTLFYLTGFSQEICNNNIDDDGDRLIDLYDIEDCPCSKADTFKISLIPNHSFEEVNCIPTGYSQLNCAVGWSQATLATSDLFSGLGFTSGLTSLPIPDGNNYVGTLFLPDWMEYIGTCLNGPLLKGQSYLLKFNVASNLYAPVWDIDFSSVSLDLVLYGKTSCGPFPIQTTICPENLGWKEVGRVSYMMNKQWNTAYLFFTPQEDIYSVMLGGECGFIPPSQAELASGWIYVFWDNLQLNLADEEIIYYVPNAFTPNGDEFNQQFNPVFVCGYDPLEYHFQVYNRWGEIVFESQDADRGWDGTYNGIPAREGVFSWKLVYKSDKTAEKKVLNGHVNLFR